MAVQTQQTQAKSTIKPNVVPFRARFPAWLIVLSRIIFIAGVNIPTLGLIFDPEIVELRAKWA
ncbi:hypothetical protein IFR04_013532 [Cadophora malorum]|uniref:Uncharacterized protein n=1 Tax=Cadophora malorum TaxID=108018 RepID=A0A8H7T572_9HELO|nr:hypothetical protein IFR04_013532 [Cadophora malorum]